ADARLKLRLLGRNPQQKMRTHIVCRVNGIAHEPLQPGKKLVVVVINAFFVSRERNVVMLSPAHMARFGGVMNVLDGVLWIALGLILILLHPRYWAASSFYDYLAVALGSLVYLALVGGQVGLHTRLIGSCGKLERLEKIS